MTRWFILPRFGSKEPSPRWGGHKDRISFNPFPLSNGHLDRVSFLLNQLGYLDPHKDHHTLGVSCFDYKCLENKNEEEESQPSKQEQQRNTNDPFTNLNALEWNWRLWADQSLELCLWSGFYSFCIECEVVNAWMVGMEVVVGIYSPQPPIQPLGQVAVDGRTGQCPVRQPRHPTIRVLTQTTVGALTSGGTGQSGAAPDMHCSLSGTPLTAALLSAAHCLCTVHLRISFCSRLLLERVVASLLHRTVRWIIAERRLRNPKLKSFELYGLVHRTVRCTRPWNTSVSFAPFFLNPNLVFLLVCVEPLCTCGIYNLEQTS
jgi:hypothetical protein